MDVLLARDTSMAHLPIAPLKTVQKSVRGFDGVQRRLGSPSTLSKQENIILKTSLTPVQESRYASTELDEYRRLWQVLNDVAGHEMNSIFETSTDLHEPWVSYQLSHDLPSGSGLFLGNSMPIRDMDMYGFAGSRKIDLPASTKGEQEEQLNPLATLSLVPIRSRKVNMEMSMPVASNRGASGIDGVLSTAAGKPAITFNLI